MQVERSVGGFQLFQLGQNDGRPPIGRKEQDDGALADVEMEAGQVGQAGSRIEGQHGQAGFTQDFAQGLMPVTDGGGVCHGNVGVQLWMVIQCGQDSSAAHTVLSMRSRRHPVYDRPKLCGGRCRIRSQ